ncbi:MAG TPA: hypothetical protein VNO75_08630 [Gemmatimonadaceae bacterium]|nr:hypothetical protein [Gemmatimonadaceae bacterium]
MRRKIGRPIEIGPDSTKYSLTPEPMYAVARAEAAIVVYDDVEEEFGVGTLDQDGILRSWSNYGELRWALQGFPADASRSGG